MYKRIQQDFTASQIQGDYTIQLFCSSLFKVQQCQKKRIYQLVVQASLSVLLVWSLQNKEGKQGKPCQQMSHFTYLRHLFWDGVNHCLEALISFCCNILSTNFSTAIATTNESQPSHLSSELEGSSLGLYAKHRMQAWKPYPKRASI